MTALTDAVHDYLMVRRALGFKLEAHARLLGDFVVYAESAGASTITTELALSWATSSPAASPGRWSQRLTVVRGFARHLRGFDPATEVPPTGLLPTHRRRAVPYLYTDADIAALMAAARTLRSRLLAATHETLIGTLAVTGLRVGEAIGLDRDDVDLIDGVLTVKHAKFNKRRDVPLHASTVDALERYAGVRDRLCPHPKSPSFFVSMVGTRLIYNSVHATFCGLVRKAGLQPRSQRCRPRLHDTRHTLATETLLDWYRTGVDIEAHMPLLSTLLGHSEPAHTYWYLSAVPELLALAAQRRHHHHQGRLI